MTKKPTPDFELVSKVHRWGMEVTPDGWPIARPYYSDGSAAGWYICIDPKLPCPTEIPQEVWAEGIEFIDQQPF